MKFKPMWRTYLIVGFCYSIGVFLLGVWVGHICARNHIPQSEKVSTNEPGMVPAIEDKK